MSALTVQIYKDIEEQIYRSGDTRISSTFWASNFPCLETSCDRQNVYRLLNIPGDKPFSIGGRAITSIGNAVEEQIVYRWGKAGITVGGSVALQEGNHTNQFAVADPDTWLHGKMDAVLDLRPKIKTVLPVDIKSKDTNKIILMQKGEASYDQKHYAQVQAYIYLCDLVYDEMGWEHMGLGRPESACIFYASRENPSQTFTFYIKADWKAIENALIRLHTNRRDYLDGVIPERDPDFMWSKDECQWCDFKKFACKPDFKAGINDLSQSHGIEFAKTIRPNYDYEETRKKVLSRWN